MYWIVIFGSLFGQISRWSLLNKKLTYYFSNLKIFYFLKILCGLLTNLVAFLPVFALVQIFKHTSSRNSKTNKLKRIIDDKISSKVNKTYRSVKDVNKSTKNIFFPWWLKIILYLISFTCMALSIAIMVFKGNNFRISEC